MRLWCDRAAGATYLTGITLYKELIAQLADQDRLQIVKASRMIITIMQYMLNDHVGVSRATRPYPSTTVVRQDLASSFLQEARLYLAV